MAARESLLPEDWHSRGRADLEAARILLDNKGDPQVAAALIQQGVEKHLKGWLLSKGWRLARVHDLQRRVRVAHGDPEGAHPGRSAKT